MENLTLLLKFLPIIIKESLSKYSWFNLGGPADIFFRPENKKQLIEFLEEVRKKNSKRSIFNQ